MSTQQPPPYGQSTSLGQHGSDASSSHSSLLSHQSSQPGHVDHATHFWQKPKFWIFAIIALALVGAAVWAILHFTKHKKASGGDADDEEDIDEDDDPVASSVGPGHYLASGNNVNGALGFGPSITGIPKVTSVSAEIVQVGIGMMARLSDDGKLTIYGYPDHFSETEISTVSGVSIVADGEPWKDLSLTHGHGLLIDKNDHIWGFGNNTDNRFLDTEDEDLQGKFLSPEPLTGSAENLNYSKVYAGPDRSAAVSKDGKKLYMWGNNADSGVAKDSETAFFAFPTEVTQVAIASGDGKITSVAMSSVDGGTLCVSDGKLYAWGDNETVTLQEEDHEVPAEIKIPEEPEDDEWLQVDVYENRVVAITKKGLVFGWGDNTSPQNIITDEEKNDVPQETLTALTLIEIDASELGLEDEHWSLVRVSEHAIFLLDSTSNTLISRGSNVHGILGHEDEDVVADASGDLTDFAIVQNLVNPKYLSVNLWAAAAINGDNTLRVWGRNYNGDLGMLTGPELITRFTEKEEELHFVDMAFSHHATFAITASGELFANGINRSANWADTMVEEAVSSTNVYTPGEWFKVSSDTGWKSVKCVQHWGGDTCAGVRDNNVYIWGVSSAVPFATILDAHEDKEDNEAETSGHIWPPLVMKVIEDSVQRNVQDVWVTEEVIFTITNGGHMFSFGKSDATINKSGGVTDFALVHHPAGTDGKWKTMDASTEFALAIDDKDRLWGWGDHEHLELEQYGENDAPDMKRLYVDDTDEDKEDAPINSNWSSVHVGHLVALVVQKDNIVYTWGRHIVGGTGRDGTELQSYTVMTLLDEEDHEYDQIYLSYGSMLGGAPEKSNSVWGIRDGNLYFWGLDRDGWSGLGGHGKTPGWSMEPVEVNVSLTRDYIIRAGQRRAILL